MLPYVHLPEIDILGLPIHWFGILVATGVLVGIWLARRRAPLHGIARDQLESFINWMLAGGFIGAHVLDTIFYHPDELVKRPWSLLFIWEGLSSMGGFAGAVLGVFLWKKFKHGGKPIMPYADLILSVYPISWIIGRAGCALVHDHKGRAEAVPNLFTVAFPDGPHYDLGLLEMFYAIFMSLVVVYFWRKPRPQGFYVGLACVLYAPVRFALDFLRVETGPTGDPRYFGFTPAQWANAALLLLGVTILTRALARHRPSPA